jgi:hypothetical protein
VCGADLQCRDACAADRDCVSAQVCVLGTCADVVELVDGGLPHVVAEAGSPTTTTQTCLYNSECAAPLICRDRVCTKECLTPADCTGGNDCVDNRCVAGSGTLVGPEGGVVSASNGKVVLTVPAGALRAPVGIIIDSVETWPEGALGAVFSIAPSGITFTTPATLTIGYTAADIGAVLPADLRVAFATGSDWNVLASTVDTTARTVSAQLAHLSTYGLIQTPKAPDAGVVVQDAEVLETGSTNRDVGLPGTPTTCTGSCTSGSPCSCSYTCGVHTYSLDCNADFHCSCAEDNGTLDLQVTGTCSVAVLEDLQAGCGFTLDVTELPP